MGEGKLAKAHYVASLLHFGLAITTLAIGVSSVKKHKIDNDLTTLPPNQHIFVQGEVINEYYVNVSAMTSVFFVITSLFHLLNATYATNKAPAWNTYVEHGSNPIRWIEYSITAPLMMVLVSILSGITSVWNLVFIFLCVWIAMGLGGIIDIAYFRPKGTTNIRPLELDGTQKFFLVVSPFIMSSILCTVPWIQVFWTLGKIQEQLAETDEKLPAIVWAMVITTFSLFMSFAFVMGIMLMIDRTYHRHSEAIYITLSFVSKTFLGLIITIGGIGINT